MYTAYVTTPYPDGELNVVEVIIRKVSLCITTPRLALHFRLEVVALDLNS